MSEESIQQRIKRACQDGLAQLKMRGHHTNEASTLDLLIKPTLTELGYPASHQYPEHEEGRNRVDISCYLNPVQNPPGKAALLVEAKQQGVDFDRAGTGQSRADSPDRQVQRYLKNHSASGPGTIGVLTNGETYRLYGRRGNQNNPDIQLLGEYHLHPEEQNPNLALLAEANPLEAAIQKLVDSISRDHLADIATTTSKTPPATLAAQGVFNSIKAGIKPSEVLKLFGVNQTDKIRHKPELALATQLQGKRKDLHDQDWQDYAYTETCPLNTGQESLLEQKLTIAAIEFESNSAAGISREDTALAARAFAEVNTSRTALILAYSISENDSAIARIAVSADRQVSMTPAFDPSLASPAARAATQQLLKLLQDAEKNQKPEQRLTPAKLAQPLEVATLRQEFYKEVDAWTSRLQQGKSVPQRQAILRHLIRIMFTWILKEEGIIPRELFEQAFARAILDNPDRYHQEVLTFLFHQRLNLPEAQRADHSNRQLDQSMQEVPFLNGSIFAQQEEDKKLNLPASEYWNTDPAHPGILTILARYHWTMDEHQPGESEQTLDPELLSNLFEQLIAPTTSEDAAEEKPNRQPQGTYYTPADVSEEMVKDALAGAGREQIPTRISDLEALNLFSEEGQTLEQLTPAEKQALAKKVASLRILDPAVGSGEFIFRILNALQRTLERLDSSQQHTAAEIIERQLYGIDINPLAAQITRLRLFIAIMADQKRRGENKPLPNLEGHIVCADTLETVADPKWTPHRATRLGDTANEVMSTLTKLAENRAQWFHAHSEKEKEALTKKDGALRQELQERLGAGGENLASPALQGLLEAPLGKNSDTPIKTDARLLFYEHPWRGFDIIIGNPPYEALSKSLSHAEVNRLKQDKKYRTTNTGDLYSLFCETALALANPENGIITLIIPLSIAFGQKQRKLRQAFEQSCKRLHLRHYDNAPGTIFTDSPTVRSPRNSQRVTILVATTGDKKKLTIASTGQQRWSAPERKECLAQRSRGTLPTRTRSDPRIAHQWPRIPTPEIAKLVNTINSQEQNVESYTAANGKILTLPKTTRYFITTIPQAAVGQRTESELTVASEDHLRLLMAVLNGHIAYGYWRVYGDGFHVNIYELTNITVPDTWAENPQEAIALGQELIHAIPDCTTRHRQQGAIWENVDFHSHRPQLVERIDRLHLKALGLPEEPLLTQLRKMRSSSSWDFS